MLLNLQTPITIRNRSEEAQRWLKVGLAMEAGHILSKLGLTDQQVDEFNRGRPNLAAEAEAHSQTESDRDDIRQLYLLTADPESSAFDPAAAAAQIEDLVARDETPVTNWALARYRQADRRVQVAIEERVDFRAVLESAAAAGSGVAQYELGMLLRRRAGDPEDLRSSAEWLRKAAEAGHRDAMVEYGYALGLGAGLEADPKLALIWLQKAESLGNMQARELITLFAAMTEE